MIKKVVNPEEFKKVVDDVYSLFLSLEEDESHHFLKHDPESIKNNLSDPTTLSFRLHVWAHYNEDGNCDGTIMFWGGYDIKFGVDTFTEFIWLCADPKVSISLFKTAEKWAKDSGKYSYISTSVVEKMPQADTLKSLYNRMGFIKDYEQYIKPL